MHHHSLTPLSKVPKIRVWAAVSGIILVAALAFVPVARRMASAQTAPSITAGPTVSSITDRTVTVTWSTSVESSSIVQYGTTSSLGLEQRNLLFVGPGEEEDDMRFSHSVTLQELTPGTTYFFRAKSDTNLSTTSDEPSAVSATLSFTTTSSTPTCTADVWDCTAYGTCGADGKQVRTCTLKTDCAGVETPKPGESQACTPACTADTWECTAYGTCGADGKQTRACTLKTDCATATTPKPAESQSCTPACTKDEWSCTAYGTCGADGKQVRTCTLKTDCATDTATQKPAETQSCSACTKDEYACTEWSACRDGSQTRACTLKNDCAADTATQKPSEKQACTSCTKDEYACSEWSDCREGSQARTCTLKTDCPEDASAAPAQKQTCTEPTTQNPLVSVAVTAPKTGDKVTSPVSGSVLVEGDASSVTVYFNPKELSVDKSVPWQASKSEDSGRNENWNFGGVTLSPGEYDVYAEAKGKDGAGNETTKTSVRLGYGIIVVGGADQESVNIQGFVVNSKSSALDLSVFVFEPEEVQTDKVTFVWDSKEDLGMVRCDGVKISIAARDGFSCEMEQPAGDYEVVAQGSGRDKDGKQIAFASQPLKITLQAPPLPLSPEALQQLIPTSVPQEEVSDELAQRILDWTSVRSTVEDFEKNTENVSGGFGLIGASQETQVELAKECRDSGIDASRCDEWLKVRYADKSCKDAGVFSKESCERLLEDKNDGVFPGCEGKTADECRRIRDVATLGYMSDDVKEKTDALVDQAIKDHVMVLLPDVMSVSDKLVDEVKWYPSAKAEGQETSAGVIVLDLDKDGLPDAVEVKLGLDPRDADSDDDGVPDGRVTRDILKSFFESGDKPTQAQFANLLDSMLKLSSVDRMFILGNPMEQPTGAGETDQTFRVFVMPHVLETSGSVVTFVGGDPNNPQCAGNLQPFRVSNNWVCGTSIGTDQSDPNTPACQDGMQPARTDEGISFCVRVPYGGQLSEDGVLVDSTGMMFQTAPDANDPRRQMGDPNDVDPNRYNTDPYAEDVTRNLVTGTALPNTTVLIYIYSYVPMVLAVETDANGNFSYDLSDSVVDGEHTVYVAVTDETGKITKKSNPLSFFVKEALAVGEEDFLRSDAASSTEPVAELKRYYVLGTIALVLVAAVIALGFIMGPKRKSAPPAQP